MSKSGVKCTALLVMQMHSQESDVIVSFMCPFQENAPAFFSTNHNKRALSLKGGFIDELNTYPACKFH